MKTISTVSSHHRRKRSLLVFLIFLLCLGIAAFAIIDIQIRPMIKTYGSNQATTAATTAVNDAVEYVLSQSSVKYEDLAVVHKDSSGKIETIESNAENMNLLKSAVSKRVLEELDKQEYQKVKIPLGSLSGGLLTGRGPNITIKVPMNSTVKTDFYNHFESAGINQTRHEISLSVTIQVYTVIQGKNEMVEVTTRFVMAENVLVGEVPQWMVSTQKIN